MRQDLKPTRLELREIRQKIQMVRRGHQMLKRKLESLMIEFFRKLSEYRKAEEEVVKAMAEASHAMRLSEMACDETDARSFAMTRTGQTGVEVSHTNFMGAKLPSLKMIRGGQPSMLLPGEPPQNITAAHTAEALIEKLIYLAAVEASVRVILNEIERTKRRVNALEIKVLPQLDEERRFIQGHLEEMEREGLFTFKRLREKLSREH